MEAVLTGDIVRSRRLNVDRRQDLYRELNLLSILLEEQYSTVVLPGSLSNFRGDSWQVVLSQPQKAVEIGLFIRSYLRYKFGSEALDTRIAIGIGTTNFIPTENLAAGDGPAFVLSGHLLEEFKSERMGLKIEENIPLFRLESSLLDGVNTTLQLLDVLITGWTPSQCQAVFWAMQNKRQTEIAQLWQPTSIRQASVSYHLNRAGWDSVKTTLEYFEKAIEQLITAKGYV